MKVFDQAFLIILVKKMKVFDRPFFKRGVGSRGNALRRRPQTAKSLYGRRSERGELKNSPVDCFLRGEALQERASPLIRPSFFSAFSQRTPNKMKSPHILPLVILLLKAKLIISHHIITAEMIT